MSKNPDDKKNRIDGVQAVADMFNVMDEESRERLLANVSQRDPKLAEHIRKKMFVFDDLTRLDGHDLQLLLREIPQTRWALALRNASPTLKETLLNNLSPRGRQLLEEEIQTLGPRRLSDIEAVQADILKTVQQLGATGKLHSKL